MSAYIMFCAIVVSFTVWREVRPLFFNKQRTDDKPKDKAIKFELTLSESIYNTYKGLDAEFQRFPDLRDALLKLEERALLNDHIQYRRLRHTRDCKGNYNNNLPFRGEEYCYSCKPFMELSEAVDLLHTAQISRARAVAEEKKQRDLDAVESTLEQYNDLAERMRAEAQIHKQVTREVFNEEP